MTFYNTNDEGASSTYTVIVWRNDPFRHRDSLHVVGTYHAGTAGFVGSQTDRGFNDIEINSARRFATVWLPYQRIGGAAVAGPTIVDLNQQFTLDADLHYPNAIPPLSWTWYRNGSFAGSTETLAGYGGSPGELQNFQVVITEGNGQQFSATHTVCTPNPPYEECPQ